MTDLDELDRLYLAAAPSTTLSGGFWEEEVATIVALHNAYPALSAELRAARAVIEVLLGAPEWERENTTHYWEEPQCQFCAAVQSAGHRDDCPRQVTLAEWRKVRGKG